MLILYLIISKIGLNTWAMTIIISWILCQWMMLCERLCTISTLVSSFNIHQFIPLQEGEPLEGDGYVIL